MINFWFVASLFIVLASLFLLVPAYRVMFRSKAPVNVHSLSREKENVDLFKERLAELDLEFSENRLSSESYQERKQELELALLNDVDQQSSITESSGINSQPLAFTVIGLSLVFVIISSIWMYQENGSKALVEEYYAMNFNAKELDQAKELAKQGDMSALLKQLHEKLKAAPNNLEGWQLLARSAMNSQRYTLAIDAYEQIIRIYRDQDANPAPIIGLLAQAQYYQSEGNLSDEVNNTIQQALDLDENELNSIGLLAIDAFSNQRFLEAKKYWVEILNVYPEHPARSSIEAGIQRVNAQLGLNEENILSKSDSANNAWVSVKVSIDDSIINLLEPSDTVFILAKAVGQSTNIKAPLAVSRHRVDDLPVTVKLDDSKSMAPIAKISMAKRVMVVARVSKSGNPMPQAGDFEAVSVDIDPKNQEFIELVIQDKLN